MKYPSNCRICYIDLSLLNQNFFFSFVQHINIDTTIKNHALSPIMYTLTILPILSISVSDMITQFDLMCSISFLFLSFFVLLKRITYHISLVLANNNSNKKQCFHAMYTISQSVFHFHFQLDCFEIRFWKRRWKKIYWVIDLRLQLYFNNRIIFTITWYCDFEWRKQKKISSSSVITYQYLINIIPEQFYSEHIKFKRRVKIS